MGQDVTREYRGDASTARSADPRARLRAARFYVDAAAWSESYAILSDVVQSGYLLADSDRLVATAMLLDCCHTLGRMAFATDYESSVNDLLANHRHALSPEAEIRGAAALIRCHMTRGKYDEALSISRTVGERAIDQASGGASIDYLSRVVEIHYRLGDFDLAEHTAFLAIGRAEVEDDSVLRGNANGVLAALFKTLGRHQESLRLYSDAARLHRNGGDLVGVARDHLNRGWLLNRMGLLEDATIAFQQAADQADKVGNRTVLQRAATGLGVAELRLGNLQSARARFAKSWRMARQNGAKRGELLASEFLAETLTLLSRFQTATRILRLCRRRAERLAPFGDIVAECAVREALLLLARGDLPSAEVSAREAVTITERASVGLERAQAERILGTVLALQGRDAEARCALTEAIHRFDQMNEGLEASLARRWMEWLDRKREAGAVTPAMDGADPIPPIHPAQQISRRASNRTAGEGTAPRVAGGASAHRKTSRRQTLDLDPVWEDLGLATRSVKMQEVLERAASVARAGDAAVILGETGTGKDLLAHGIHRLSLRTGEFVPFNCASCPSELVENELFGSEKGAFTGSQARRAGLIAQARGGTLFLDEIGDLPARAQGSLLRFLDHGEVRPLGSDVTRNIDARIVAATHRPLPHWAELHEFRHDLYYRLAQGVVRIPPLRERLEDLDLLVEHLWARLVPGEPMPEWLFDDETTAILRSHPWPGNIRELEVFVRRARMQPDCRPTPARLREWILTDETVQRATPTLEDVQNAVRLSGGNHGRAASILGISRQRLYRMLKKSGREKT